MKLNFVFGTIAALMTFALLGESAAQTLVQRSFDLVLEGDDPGESFTFDLAFDPVVPSVVRFDGSFINLDPAETGVSYTLLWPTRDGSAVERAGGDFVRLPASGRLPLQFEHPIGFTPDNVRFIVDGGGPADHFQFVGDFAIQQVPEPSALALCGTIALAGLLRRRTGFPARWAA
jgi:hypothetical protein